MARPREFDLDQVLQDAQRAFWTHGYEATSIHDLLEATGLQRGSLYKAFGDKHGLFLTTLKRYQDQALAHVAQLLDSPKGPLAGLRRWLAGVAGGCPDNGPRAGCFVINCTIELAPHDADVAALTTQHRRDILALITRTVAAAQDAEELRRTPGAKEMAQHLLLVVAGLTVEGKAGASSRARRTQAELALRLLETTQ